MPYTLRDQMTDHRIPRHMQEGLAAYIERGQRPGSFLYAVLSNDLAGAIRHADSINAESMPDYVTFMEACMAPGSYGSARNVAAWIKYGKAKIDGVK